MSLKERILKFANKFDEFANHVEKEKVTFNGKDVYSCSYYEDGLPVNRSIGQPYFILHDKENKKLQYVTGNTALKIVGML